MSALLRLSSAPSKTNQFIRPMSPFDVVSAARGMALSGKWFAAAPEYAEAISRGRAIEFADALMAALGDATAMCAEDACALADLYTSNDCTHKVPHMTVEADGDEAAWDTGNEPATGLL